MNYIIFQWHGAPGVVKFSSSTRTLTMEVYGPNINSLTSPLLFPWNQKIKIRKQNAIKQMSRLSSSSSVSFVDPLTYYSTSPHVIPFGYHPNPDHNTMKDCFDLKLYSSSLPSNQFVMHNTPSFNSSSTPSSSSSSSGEYLDFNSSPIRRVFSTGDLQVILFFLHFIPNCFLYNANWIWCGYEQGMNGLQASSKEAQANETGTVTSKVGRYSAEERKERIERYKTKRQQRNFQKKITVCAFDFTF